MAVTRTPKVPNPSVARVNTTSGEFLQFTLKGGGPIPIFAFTSSVKGTLWEAADFLGHPKRIYRWEHLKNPSDAQQLEGLTLSLAFFSNANYSYKLELCDAAGQVKKVVFDIAYTGQPTDSYDEFIRVVLQ
jgi:hypothetical protein